MNDSNAALELFIQDFDLRKSEGIISFKATIHFLKDHKPIVFESDIQVITSDRLAAIYLLYAGESPEHLPDLFTPSSHSFSHIAGECLKIQPLSGDEKYNLSIFPGKV